MILIKDTPDFLLDSAKDIPAAVGIGKFDGMHRGHTKLLQALQKKKKDGYRTVLFTFDPPPEFLFLGEKAKVLTTREEKRALFEAAGADVLIEFPFTRETAAVPAERFLSEYLVERIGTKYIAAGADLSFGDRGKGDLTLLREKQEAFGYEVEEIEKVVCAGEEISSTRIRGFVENGRMEEALQCMERPYGFSGEVLHGKKLGRTLGFPTVNILPAPEKCLPPYGVYYSRVRMGEEVFSAVTNIGVRPTVSEENRVNVETFLFDCEKDLYGETISVDLLHFARPEKKFADLKALEEGVQRDVQAARAWHAKNPA